MSNRILFNETASDFSSSGSPSHRFASARSTSVDRGVKSGVTRFLPSASAIVTVSIFPPISASDDTIALHLYGGISTTIPLAAGKVTIRETSTYPWSGAIRITVTPEIPTPISLKLRIPGWTSGATAAVNGAPINLPAATRDGYATISRTWTAGDEVTLDLPMPPERLYAHPAVAADLGRVALRRGPLLYCLEEADNPGAPVQRLTLPRTRPLRPEPRDDLWPGVIALSAAAQRLEDADWTGTLYRPAPPTRTPAGLTAIPYFLWNNRTRGSMTVWIPEL